MKLLRGNKGGVNSRPEIRIQFPIKKETQDLTLIDRPIELGFPLHTEVVKRFFAEKETVKKGG